MKLRKFFPLMLLFVMLTWSMAAARTVEKEGKIYLSGDKKITLICSVSDGDGVGMDQGKMQFRVLYNDNTFSVWGDELIYAKSVPLILVVEKKLPFVIQGRFSDSLENWQEEVKWPKTSVELVLDEDTPAGTVNVKVDIKITVTVE